MLRGSSLERNFGADFLDLQVGLEFFEHFKLVLPGDELIEQRPLIR